MRHLLLDKTTVCAKKPREVYLGIVNLQRQPLSDEVLGQKYERAFPQIVSASLERESDQPYAPLAAREDLRYRVVDMGAVRLHDTAVHWQLDIA